MNELPIKARRVTPLSGLFSIDDIPVKPSRGTAITPVKPARATPTIATTPTFITRAVIPEVVPAILPLSAVNDDAYWEWAKTQNFEIDPIIENTENNPEQVVQTSPNSKRKTILIIAAILLAGYLIFKKK